MSDTEDFSDLHFTDRLALVAYDLRQVSLWLEERRDDLAAAGIGDPYFDGSSTTLRLQFVCFTPDQLAAAARILADRAPVGAVEKDMDGDWVHVRRRFGSVVVDAFAGRDRVCTRVEVGTETVEVADPEAATVVVQRPVYEWKCGPLLNEAVA